MELFNNLMLTVLGPTEEIRKKAKQRLKEIDPEIWGEDGESA
jgi:hypothetical protein